MTSAHQLNTEQVAPYPGDPRYLVTTAGAVYSTRKGGRWLRPGTMNKFGHVSVALGRGNSRCVHAMVLETFVGPRPGGHDTAHLNGIGDDNRLENLQWKTRRENNFDMAKHDRHRLTRAQVASIFTRYAAGETGIAIAADIGCSFAHVYMILKGETRTRG